MRQAVIDLASQPVTNLIHNPFPTSTYHWFTTNWGTGGAGTTSYDTTVGAYLSTVTTAATDQSFTVRHGVDVTNKVKVTPGVTYTQTLQVMSDVADARAFAIDWTQANGANSASGSTVAPVRVVLPANTWVTLTLTGTAPADSVFASACVVYVGTSGTPAIVRPVGSKFWVRRATFFASSSALPYADGSAPGWNWTGTAGQSESRGYPYTLNSIAGPPRSDISTPGTTVALDGVTDLSPLTIYHAANRLTDTAFWTSNSGINSYQSGFSRSTGFAMQQSGSNADSWQFRLDTIGSGNGFNTGQGGAVTLGQHVFAGQVIFDGSQTFPFRTFLDGVNQGSRGLTANAGVERYQFTMQPVTSDLLPYRLLLYKAFHDQATVNKITAWLARQYGGTVPAGY